MNPALHECHRPRPTTKTTLPTALVNIPNDTSPQHVKNTIWKIHQGLRGDSVATMANDTNDDIKRQIKNQSGHVFTIVSRLGRPHQETKAARKTIEKWWGATARHIASNRLRSGRYIERCVKLCPNQWGLGTARASDSRVCGSTAPALGSATRNFCRRRPLSHT